HLSNQEALYNFRKTGVIGNAPDSAAAEIKNFVSLRGALTLENTEDDAATQHAEHVGTLRTPHLDRYSICMEKCRCTAEEVDPHDPKSVRLCADRCWRVLPALALYGERRQDRKRV